MSEPRPAPDPEPAIGRWSVGKGPIVAAAIHDGHWVRPEVAERLALGESERLREEDPFTSIIATDVGGPHVAGLRSRFEVDLNRPRDKAVYLRPEDAWGLNVWREPPPADVVERSLALHDDFYRQARAEFDALRRGHGRFVVFDIHSYNHRRGGAGGPPEDPSRNPEINIGTGTMGRARWAAPVDRVIADLRKFDFLGRHLDVRENVRFQGGYFSQWVHTTFPESGCALAVEFKKIFMDEWTGEPDPAAIAALGAALRSTVPGILEELRRA